MSVQLKLVYSLVHNFRTRHALVFIQATIPVIIQNYFGYGIFENSLVYMTGGLEALLIFFTMAFVSRYVRDTTLLIIGWTLMILSQIWLMVVIPLFAHDQGKDKLDLQDFLEILKLCILLTTFKLFDLPLLILLNVYTYQGRKFQHISPFTCLGSCCSTQATPLLLPQMLDYSLNT